MSIGAVQIILDFYSGLIKVAQVWFSWLLRRYRAIANMPSYNSINQGFFRWKERMGIHEAYHQNITNRFIHWSCIPLELWAVVKLLSLVPLVENFDLALLTVLIISPIFVLTEIFIGSLMIAFLIVCWKTATLVLVDSYLWGMGLAVTLFSVTFFIQVAIGHKIFEGGRDDTEKNIAEFAETKNPIPLLLVFYYHLVEIILNLHYRPDLKSDIEKFKQKEILSWNLPTPTT